MVKKNDQDYPFIKETIKKRPVDKGALFRKLATAAVCGVLFGLFAAVTIVMVTPRLQQVWGGGNAQGKQTIQLSPSAENASQTADGQTEKNGIVSTSDAGGDTAQKGVSGALTGSEEAPAADLDGVYETVKAIAREPRKALVRVAGLSDDSDLLDDSFLTYGDAEGIVFLKNDSGFYILISSEDLLDTAQFRITFSDGSAAMGEQRGADPRTNLIVLYVPAENLEEDTVKNVPAVTLSSDTDLKQAQPVIAIGNPAGDMDSLVFGYITSLFSRRAVADAEYQLITTNMVGSREGGGILLDEYGKMTGLILTNDEEEPSIVRALSAAQLRPLLEMLSNGEKIRYTGIIGGTITPSQAKNLNIPEGVYVDSVEPDSPAMTAGIQSGDILFRADGTEIATMEEYSTLLQKLDEGHRLKLTLYRRSPAGEYVEVEFSVSIKEK